MDKSDRDLSAFQAMERKMTVEYYRDLGVDGFAPGTPEFVLYPTYRCQLHCYMCHVLGPGGKKRPDLLQVPDPTLEQIRAAFDDVALPAISYLGGEPFARKDMIDILRYFDGRGIPQVVSTNGVTLGEQTVEKLTQLETLKLMQVSINSSKKEVDDKIRGVPNTWERTIAGIKRLTKAGVPTWIQYTMVKENVDDLVNTVRLGAELGVDVVCFLFANIVSLPAIQETEVLLKKWFGEEVRSGGYINELGYSEEQLLSNVRTAQETGRELGVQVAFYPRIFEESPETYWREDARETKDLICQMFLVPPGNALVEADGGLRPCPSISKSFGNLWERPFEEFWNSEQIRTFRKGLINNNMMPVCSRCPALGVAPQ